jgi:hypothetical protein
MERLDEGAILELPDVKGLPLHLSDPRTQKPLPVKDMFVHQGNYEKYMKQFEEVY